MGHQFSPKICLFVVATFLFLGYKVNSKTSEYIARRVFAYQREVPRPDIRPPEGRSGRAKSSDNGKQIICINGKVMYHKCVCKLDYFGEHCESKMFCNGFEREMNLSCVACDDNYSGERCDHPKCRNGGVQHTSEQRCQCLQPYSGDFCETLKVEDVYRFYNTKAALVGPLGILTVIPMLICFYMCEKKARIRQVVRIQKSWSEQRKASIQSAHIASLLAEKA
ncbi:hypothetical protein GPALN_005199 [Globodera pallida]|nr:hypothetical protein GPALN_005199 [Globodera pallida]